MISDNIKEIRIRRGLTQAQLADKVGVSEKTVSSWEVGRTEPNMGYIESISKALNCQKSELVGEPAVLSDTEYTLLKKFRVLDGFGVKSVLSVLNNEYDRCLAMDKEKEKNSLLA